MCKLSGLVLPGQAGGLAATPMRNLAAGGRLQLGLCGWSGRCSATHVCTHPAAPTRQEHHQVCVLAVQRTLTYDCRDDDLRLLGCQAVCPLVEVWVAGVDLALSQVRGKLLGGVPGLCYTFDQRLIKYAGVEGGPVPEAVSHKHGALAGGQSSNRSCCHDSMEQWRGIQRCCSSCSTHTPCGDKHGRAASEQDDDTP